MDIALDGDEAIRDQDEMGRDMSVDCKSGVDGVGYEVLEKVTKRGKGSRLLLSSSLRQKISPLVRVGVHSS